MRALILVALISYASVAHAAGIWEAVNGCWAGDGEVSGMSAAVELEFRPALDGRGRHLAFFNRMQAEDGKQWPFRAEAFYLCDEDGSCQGHWYDTRGMTLPLRATAAPGWLVVEWGDEATERGRTTYRLHDDGRLEITDEVRKDDAWKVFGKTTATRCRTS